MNTDWIKNLLPHLFAYLIMLAISFIFYAPAAFQGKVLNQYDNNQALATQQEAKHFQELDGQVPLWTNSMFGGMPAYQIRFQSKNNLTKYPWKAFSLFQSVLKPHIATLLLMFGVYLLLVVMKVDWRIALLGGVAFGLGAYNTVWTHAGHSIKVIAIAYIAPILAGVLLAYRGKLLVGGALTALFLSMQILANHLQITYYTGIVLLILGLVFLVDAILKKTLPDFLKASGVLVIAALLALGANTTRLWTTYEYGQETIRGESELMQKQSSSGGTAEEGGLSKSYAFQYSYGVLETYNLLIPRFLGGQSSKYLFQDQSTETYRALSGLGQQANNYIPATSQYWGTQSSAAPAYMGAIIMLLFFLGAFLVRGPTKVWLVVATILTIMMSWGSNFPGLNYALFDYFPMYNKFRAVNMLLSITNVLIVVLAALGMNAFFQKNSSKEDKKKALFLAGGITGGLCLLALLLSGMFGYGLEGQNLPENLASAIVNDRSGLLRSDALRSFAFVAIGFGLLFLYLKGSLKALWITVALILLVAVDNWQVSRRVLNTDDFISKIELSQIEKPGPADQQILQDKDPHFRVADFSKGSPFANGFTSWHHKSIGGYHAAKLMRIQELIERYLNNPNSTQHIFGMLNVKYFIQGDRAQRNQQALGNAWFVNSLQIFETADEEIAALQNIDPRRQAVMQKKYAEKLGGWTPSVDSSAYITLSNYHPDRMEYTYSSNRDQLAMFSEVYYPPSKGWKVYLDGEPYDDFLKANFLLRAVKLPPGQNRKLVMEFHPRSYYTGEKITLFASLLTLLGLIGALVLFFRNNGLPSPGTLPMDAPAKKTPVKPTKSSGPAKTKKVKGKKKRKR
ncbi:MAG: hypothetical protein HKN16_00710 [Saprospiraceae bacterium]|nr:hypothetical protein [Saprospiraceae bacterium]